MHSWRAGDWSRALVNFDVLLRDASLRSDAGAAAGRGALQRGMAGCLQSMGCTHLLQSYWRSAPGHGDGEESGAERPPLLS